MLLPDVVTIDKEIMSGTPVFKGTRVPVKNLIDYLEGGYDDVDHVTEVGWSSIKNGKLLGLAVGAGYEVLVTTDQNL